MSRRMRRRRIRLGGDVDRLLHIEEVFGREATTKTTRGFPHHGDNTKFLKHRQDDSSQLPSRERPMVQAIENAERVEFCEPLWGKYASRVVARVVVDGEDLAEELIVACLASAYDGGQRQRWCGDG